MKESNKTQAQPNPENERIKRKYFQYAKEAGQKGSVTIDSIAKSILRYESSTKFRDFSRFKQQDAVGFKAYLAGLKNQKGEPLSQSTVFHTARAVKEFFKWLAYQPGYKQRISILDLDYFNLSDSDVRLAKTPGNKDFPTIEQIRKAISLMPQETDIQRRDRALIAFTLLSGMRDKAIVSLKLKHIDLDRERITQDAKEVKTKFSKTITTYFFPVGDDIKQIVIEWIIYLLEKKLFSTNDPVFPRTKIILDENNTFASAGLEPKHWSGANPVRDIFRIAFENAGLPYFNPHSFRDTIVNFGEKICRNPEDFKAWSQNIGHEQVMTTFTSYGIVSTYRQGEIILNLQSKPKEQENPINELSRKFDAFMALQAQKDKI